MVCLVTTSIESTFCLNSDILFLGKWCLRYSNASNSSLKNSRLVKNNINDEEERKTSLFHAIEIKKKLIKKVTFFLNDYHKINLGEREWNIILGHWLQKYVDTLYNRFDTISKLLEDYNFDYTIVLSKKKFNFFVDNSADFTNATNDEFWNHFLFYEILHYNNFNKIEFLESGEEFRHKNIVHPKRKIRSVTKSIFSNVSLFFAKRNKIFISNTYLPIKYEYLLNLSFLQVFGYFLTPPIIYKKNIDYQSRSISLSNGNNKNVEEFIFKNILQFIPKTFLEDFDLNFKLASKLFWPKNPKTIFISNNFDTNDIFKFYIVNKIIKCNTRYVVGQHGAHYGTTLQYEYYPEYESADNFITWGWKNRESDIIGFNLKTVGFFNSYKKKSQTKYLILSMPILHRNVLWDVFEFQDRYQEDQFKFISNLINGIRADLEIKLHPEHTKKIWYEKERFLDFDNLLKFDLENNCVLQKFLESKIVIHTYDSTGILECLAMNVPMIAFWTQDIYLLNEEAKLAYDMMIQAKVFFKEPTEASFFLNTIKDNEFEWWNSLTVQKARLLFCDQYCKIENNPIFSLKSKLNFE